MKKINFKDMKKGWFVGAFNPTTFKTNACEVAYKKYSRGDYEESHYHKIATEITLIIKGFVKMNNKHYKAGDTIVIKPRESTDFKAVTDCETIVVKIPGILNDKYLKEMKKYNILRCGDQNFWAYYLIAQEHRKYSVHNIMYAKHDEVKLDNIDLIYIHSPNITNYHAISLPREAHQKGIKVVGAYAGEPNFWHTNNEKLYSYADLIVTISPQTYQFAKNNYKNVPIIFLPESIDTNFFYPDFEKLYKPIKDEFIVGWAGGARKKVKRCYLLDYLNFNVVKKSDWEELRKTQKADLDTMLKFYHSINCLVITSITECQPRTVMEAMACGLPVVSTDVGSIRMLLDPKWIVPVNPDQTVIKEINYRLELLQKNPNLRKEVGVRNLHHINKYWNWKNNVILWDTVFSALIEGDMTIIQKVSEQYLELFPKTEVGRFYTSKEENKAIATRKIQGKIAILYNTFLRDKLMYDTVSSILKHWQDNWQLYIADQGRLTEEKTKFYNKIKSNKVKVYQLPFDCGLSYARNFLVKEAQKDNIKYCWITSDNIWFTQSYNVDSALRFLESEANVGIVGFRLDGYAWEYNLDVKDGTFNLIRKNSPVNFDGIAFKKYDLVPNFFLAKIGVLLQNPWDEQLKMTEHIDFFWNLKKNSNCRVYFMDSIVAKRKTYESAEYERYRGRHLTEKFRAIVKKKWKLTGWIKRV